MATSGANVFRYSALFGGIFYGIYHQAGLSAAQKVAETDRKYKSEESLIAKAKAEYLKKTMPTDKLTSSGNVISDPNDPKFDLEAYLTMAMADGASK